MVSAIHSRLHTLVIFVAATLVVAPRLAVAQEAVSMNMDHDHLHHRHAIFDKVPEKSRVQPNPLTGDPDATTAGKKLFAQHCASCHGENAVGIRHKAPNLHKEEVQSASPGSIFWVLSNGIIRHGMPDWSKLPEAQRWQLTSYIKSFSPANTESQIDAHEHQPPISDPSDKTQR
ncbi:MAG TPA: cytochrome c [Terriglobales bacterium]|nr:cytochrome c [Terriglobales bacterium]